MSRVWGCDVSSRVTISWGWRPLEIASFVSASVTVIAWDRSFMMKVVIEKEEGDSISK